MNRTHVKGFESRGAYGVYLTYNVSFGDVVRVIMNSKNCKQFIKYECKSASIRNPIKKEFLMTYWTDRDGEEQKYFGGSTPETKMCACGETKTCVEKDLSCNCDKNDEVWREDSGYITTMDDLPITAFNAGDTGKYQLLINVIYHGI